MLLCFISDLHLTAAEGSAAHEAFDYFLAETKKRKPGLIICAGDFTADGDTGAAARFTDGLGETGVPFILLAGNADLRTPATAAGIKKLISPPERRLNPDLIALDDCERELSEAELTALENAAGGAAVVMHHPPEALKEPWKSRFALWRTSRPDVTVFSAHLHRFNVDGRDVSLPAADPDKATGASPSVLYYNTETGEMRENHFYCPPPREFFELLGISCYSPLKDIPFAAAHGLKYIELRPGAVSLPRDELAAAVERWRESGGEGLSLHAPDIEFDENKGIKSPEKWEEFCRLARELKPERITLHVPGCSVDDYTALKGELSAFAAHLGDMLPEGCVIGIENMHMTPGEKPDGTRRFGYTPDECLEFMRLVGGSVNNPVGINLDIGHARNNAPFSQKNTLSLWYAQTGEYTVGYHIHQVTNENGAFQNHTPFTKAYGRLISLASFFRGLQSGRLNRAPVILEIRDGGCPVSVECFERLKSTPVFDLHSHTDFSFCGRDKPDTMIEAAIRNGVDILGITDHSYGVGKRKAEYLALQRSLAEKYAGRIRILCGIEVPTVDTHYDITSPDEISGFDYALIEHIDRENSVARDNLFEFLDGFKLRCGIAHTDLFTYCESRGLDPLEFFKELKKRDIFWELNVNYDSVHHYTAHEYVKRFFADEAQQRIIRESGVSLSVGFDCHRADDYDGSEVAGACTKLYEAGFPLAFVRE